MQNQSSMTVWAHLQVQQAVMPSKYKSGQERNEQEEKAAKLPKSDYIGIFMNSCQWCVCAPETNK